MLTAERLSPVEPRIAEGVTFLAVGIPTRGRPVILKETLRDLKQQSRVPDAVFVVYLDPSDIGDAPACFPEVVFLQGTAPGGSCSQRNRLLDVASEAGVDLLLIMDDDCYLHRDYLLRMEQLFRADASIVGATGQIVENGACGPGLSGTYARSLLRGIARVPTLEEAPAKPAFNTDGCNMIFRVDVLRREGIRFDETMPGYAWYEDIDFSRRLLPFGRLALLEGAQAVHLGAKVGKTSGLRYGYSQIANPIYLARKGSYPWDHAHRSVMRNCLANLLRSIAPESYVDRRGRLRGNLIGVRDFLLGRLRPDRILALQ